MKDKTGMECGCSSCEGLQEAADHVHTCKACIIMGQLCIDCGLDYVELDDREW